MNDDISMPGDIVEFAQELIGDEPGALTIIKIYESDDDTKAHDDAFQARTHREFEKVFRSLVDELSAQFGDPQLSQTEDEFDTVPLGGVLPAATLEVDDSELYLAVAHEDRELPYLLAIGTA